MKSTKLTNHDGSCSYCFKSDNGHNASNCPLLSLRASGGNVYAKKLQNRYSGGGRVCSFCAEKDHNSTNCPSRFYQFKASLVNQKQVADPAFQWLHEIGFGPGAMLNGMSRESAYWSKNKEERIVVINDFNSRVATMFFNELLWGDKRNWYTVCAVDTSNEDVRSVYLPFHPTYAPRPTSMKVQIVHKANPDDIEKLKSHLTCYNNPVMLVDTAEQFFAEGFKFVSGNNKNPEIDYTAYNANQSRKSKVS